MCFVAIGIVTALALHGCSISNSSGSVSDSAGSIAKSSESISDSSKSSSKDDEKSDKKDNQADLNRFENEVTDYTVTYVRANAVKLDRNEFMTGISDVATQNGVVDWESKPNTYRAIGRGLKRVRVSSTLYEDYKRQLSDGDASKVDDIVDGYNY